MCLLGSRLDLVAVSFLQSFGYMGDVTLVLGVMFEPFSGFFVFLIYNYVMIDSHLGVGWEIQPVLMEAWVAKMQLFIAGCPALDLPLPKTNKFSIGLFCMTMMKEEDDLLLSTPGCRS